MRVALGTSLLLVVTSSTWSYVIPPTTTNSRSQRLIRPDASQKKYDGNDPRRATIRPARSSLNGNSGNKKNGDDDDNDFSTFLDGLQLWPQFNDGDSTENKAQAAKSSSRYRGVNPFSSIINVEALLELATSLSDNETTTTTTPTTDTDTNNIADQQLPDVLPGTSTLFGRLTSPEQEEEQQQATESFSNVTTVGDFIAWEKWMEDLQKKIVPSSSPITTATTPKEIEQEKTSFFRDATNRIEYLVGEASTASASVQDLIIRASRASPTDIVRAAEALARDRGISVQQATERARETTRYAAMIISVANSVYGAGYAVGSKDESGESSLLDAAEPESKPLLAEFASARAVAPAQYESIVAKGAEMGALSGAVYGGTVAKCHELGHSLVANGTTDNVAWVVTDSIGYEEDYVEIGYLDSSPNKPATGGDNNNKRPVAIRTITFRGFDASDETVDREELLVTICSAAGKVMDADYPDILFHSGLLATARKLYKDLIKYVDWASPNHKLVLNGHSIGGSLAILFLFLMTIDRGVDFVEERLFRVYAYGSPPVAVISPAVAAEDLPRKGKKSSSASSTTGDITYDCEILEAFGLQSDMVYGYIQPWDPIVRFCSEIDALYPLVDDLGKDGVTLYASGPPRSLRPMTKALFQSWEGWPRFRSSWKGTNQENYNCVGIQHLLLPEPLRYLNDRFVSVNIGVPPTDSIVRIASRELLPALAATFPMDVFQISFIPQAVRSFLHHFFPAYDFTIVNYAAKVAKQTKASEKSQKGETNEVTLKPTEPSNNGLKSPVSPLAWGRTLQRGGAPSPFE